MSLSSDLDALMVSITTRSAAMVTEASPTDLVILAKAAEAMRGTIALQSVIQASTDGQASLSTALTAALASLATALTTSQGSLTTQQASITAALAAISTSYTNDMLAVLNSSGNYRVGDMWLALIPNPAVLPSNVWLLDGSLKATADCPLLVNAWGLNVGDTPAPFVANYNSTNPYSLTVAVASNQLRLPNMAGGFLRGRATGDIGTYQVDAIKPHTHPAAAGAFVNKLSSGGAGVASGSGITNLDVASADTGVNTGAQTETRPVNYAGVWLVRYK